jgi:hypothetical protein
MPDYDALAAKYGATTGQPDLDALAAKYGAVGVPGAVTPDNSLMGRLGAAYQDMKTNSQQVPYVGGLLHGFLQTPHAVTQLIANLGNQAGVVSDKDLADFKNLSNSSEQAYQTTRQATTAQKPSDIAQGKVTPPGFDWGSFAGNALSTAPLLAAKVPTSFAGVSFTGAPLMAAKALQGMGIGAAMGALTPADDALPNAQFNADKLKQLGIGVGLGGVAPVIGSAVGKTAGGLLNAVRPIVAPRSAVGNSVLENMDNLAQQGATSVSPQDLLNRLRSVQQLVPGSQPTTAQVAGVPQLVMAEKTLKNNPTYLPDFLNRAIGNNQARLQALQGIAQTPEALQAAIAARNAAASPLYDAAKNATLPVDDALQEILDRPSAQSAIQRGMKIAAERGDAVAPIAGTKGSATATSAILDAQGKPIVTQAAQSGQAPTISGNLLQYLKMGLDDLQSSGRTQGIGSHEANALSGTQDALQAWIEKNSPQYAAANKAYAEGSVPVNTMQAGQQLYNALAGGTMNAAGDVAPALSQFRSQYAKALKDATYGIDPEAQKTLDAIQADLQRETVSNSVRAGSGSDTAFNLQAPNWLAKQIYGPGMAGKSTLGQILGGVGGYMTGGPMGAAGGVMGVNKLGQFAGQRMSDEMQKAMLNPDYFAQLLQDAIQRNAAPGFQNLSPVWTRAPAAAVGLLTSR